MKTEKLNYELLPGDLFADIVKIAIEQANNNESLVEFMFDGIKVIVDKNSTLEYVIRDYNNIIFLGGTVVKPPYKKTIDKETNKKIKDHLEKIEQQKKEQEIKEKELREKENKAILERIKNIKLEVKNEKEWEKFKNGNQEQFGKTIIDFAERWGKLMQVDMKSGLSVEESAPTTSLEADFEGITGAMAQLGKSVLIKFWKYGDKLEKVKHI